MIKRLIILFWLVCVPAALYAASHPKEGWAEPVCDLNKGTLNNLKVGDPVDKNKIIKHIGNGSNLDISKDDFFGEIVYFYNYMNRGIALVGQKDPGKKEFLYDFQIYFNGYKDLDGNIFSDFKGIIIPQVTPNETVSSIKTKFGTPDKEFIGGFGSSELHYNRSHGTLIFWFDDNKLGQLGRITVRVKR